MTEFPVLWCLFHPDRSHLLPEAMIAKAAVVHVIECQEDGGRYLKTGS